MKNRLTAILLALFLGGVGAHKFYLKRFSAGILYIIFFWTLIPSIIAFIEMIVYICMSDSDFSAKYSQKSVNNENPIDSLAKLHEMKEKGILSDSEFIEKKDRLMKNI